MRGNTLVHERDDNPHSVELLQEMFAQPSAPEPDRTDEVDVAEARIGEFAPIERRRRNSMHPPQLGRIGLRHAAYPRIHEIVIDTSS